MDTEQAPNKTKHGLPVYTDGSQRFEPVYPGACMTREQAQRYGDRNIPKDLKRAGFRAFVFRSDRELHGHDYYRICYGKLCPKA